MTHGTHSTSTASAPGQPVPNLGAGIAAGIGAGLVGALLWGGFTEVTNLRIGYLAIGVGFLVAFAMTRAGGGHSVGFGATAAVITLLACALGDVGSLYFKASHELHVSVSTLMSAVGPLRLLREDLSHDKFGAVFFAIAAFAAFRYGASGARSMPRRRAVTGSQPPYGQQPAYGPPPTQPQYGPPPAAQPTYGQPPLAQPTYGQPTYGQPTDPQQPAVTPAPPAS
jgi:hypothetical protein